MSLIFAKKKFNFSIIVVGSFDVPSSVISSSRILGADALPLRSLICFHKYELSLFSAIDLEKKSLFCVTNDRICFISPKAILLPVFQFMIYVSVSTDFFDVFINPFLLFVSFYPFTFQMCMDIEDIY